MQIADVLKNIDITKLSSAKSIANIFQSLGRLLLESLAENLLLDLRARGMIVILLSYLSSFVDGMRGGTLFYFEKTLYVCVRVFVFLFVSNSVSLTFYITRIFTQISASTCYTDSLLVWKSLALQFASYTATPLFV